jgi:phosphonate transport system substrate-binding protein
MPSRKPTPRCLRCTSTAARSHFDNLAALWAREVDVIVNNSTDLAVFQTTREPASQGQLRVLWESPLVPNDVLMVRRNAPAVTRAALRAFFIQRYGKADEERALLQRASGIAQFVAADNTLLTAVADFKFATERAAIHTQASHDDATKAAALAALVAREEIFKRALMKAPD